MPDRLRSALGLAGALGCLLMVAQAAIAEQARPAGPTADHRERIFQLLSQADSALGQLQVDAASKRYAEATALGGGDAELRAELDAARAAPCLGFPDADDVVTAGPATSQFGSMRVTECNRRCTQRYSASHYYGPGVAPDEGLAPCLSTCRQWFEWLRGVCAARVAPARAERLNAAATHSLAEDRFARARSLLAQCLQLLPHDPACLETRARMDGQARGNAKRLFAAGRFRDALSESTRCHELFGDPQAGQTCASIEEQSKEAVAELTPQHIKDFAIYEEGDGFITYFSLVNANGDYVRASGVVVLGIAREAYGHTFWVVPVASYRVGEDDFKQSVIGLGAFQRDVLAAKKWLKEDDLYSRVAEQMGGAADRSVGRTILQAQGGDLSFEVKFTDDDGGSFTSRTAFAP